MKKTQRDHARLRLVWSQRDLCKSNNLSAASPLGAPVRPCSMSLMDEGASPTSTPICESVMPVERSSDMRMDHVVMAPRVREPEVWCQRAPVSMVRNNGDMPRPSRMPSDLNTVGQRVKWWREWRGLEQVALAKASKIAPSTLSDLENDRQTGSRKLHLIAAALRLNAHYLESGKGEPESEYAQEAPQEPTTWPFAAVTSAQLDKLKLNLIERSYVESKLREALDAIEAERRKARKAG